MIQTHRPSARSIKIQFYTMHKQNLLWNNLLAAFFNSSKKTKQYDQQCSLKFRVTTWEHFFFPWNYFCHHCPAQILRSEFFPCLYVPTLHRKQKKAVKAPCFGQKHSIVPQILLNPVGIIPQDSGVNKRTIPRCHKLTIIITGLNISTRQKGPPWT